MARSFSTTFNLAPATAVADKLDALSDRVRLRLRAADVVNEVTVRFQDDVRKRMNQGLNLTDAYVAERMRRTPARSTGTGPLRAEIVTRGDLTIIGHYPHAQLSVAGSKARSGPTRGRRPSGVAVEIKRGSAEFEAQWFTMRLRRGTQSGDKVGLFVRTTAGGGKPKHLYGPSPYSLFRFQIENDGGRLLNDLEATAVDQLTTTVREALS